MSHYVEIFNLDFFFYFFERYDSVGVMAGLTRLLDIECIIKNRQFSYIPLVGKINSYLRHIVCWKSVQCLQKKALDYELNPPRSVSLARMALVGLQKALVGFKVLNQLLLILTAYTSSLQRSPLTKRSFEGEHILAV